MSKWAIVSSENWEINRACNGRVLMESVLHGAHVAVVLKTTTIPAVGRGSMDMRFITLVGNNMMTVTW